MEKDQFPESNKNLVSCSNNTKSGFVLKKDTVLVYQSENSTQYYYCSVEQLYWGSSGSTFVVAKLSKSLKKQIKQFLKKKNK